MLLKRTFGVCVGLLWWLSCFAEARTVPKEVNLDGDSNLYERLANDQIGDESIPLGFFEEVPDGLSTKDMSPHCDPRRLEDSVVGKKLSLPQYFSTLKQYFSRCQSELVSRSPLGKWGLFKFSKFIYPFFSHPQVSEFLVRLPNGTKVPGILALKNDPRPRPLVIVKCGVFCSAWTTATMKSYLMHLFDQSPFNVLLLANQTGMDYIYHNKRISLGGFTEGYEALQVGKWMMEQWEHRDRISSIHLMGISLGGNAAVLGAAYNDMYPLPSGKKVFSSVTAICPVISLRPTLEKLYDSQIVGRAFEKTTRDHFLEARNYITDVPDLISEGQLPSKRRGYSDFIGNLAVTSLNRRSVPLDLAGFFRSNNFFNLKESVKTPLLVWASKDDTVVSNRINAQVLEYDDGYEKVPHVGVLNLSYGDHCGFSSAYGAQAAATVLRTYVLQNSPEFVASYDAKRSLAWTFGFKKLGPQYEHVGQTWKFENGKDKVKVSFRIFEWSRNDQCMGQGPWEAGNECLSTQNFWIPIKSLQALGARVPRSEAEAQALTREFNTKVEFRTKNEPLNGTHSSQFFMTWRNHFE